MTYDQNTQTITTDRLTLRLFTIADAPKVTELCTHEAIYAGTLNLPKNYTIESAQGWIPHHQPNFEQDKAYELAITHKLTGELLGAIALSNNVTLKKGEIAYWVGYPYWGNGYATEALQAIIDFAFQIKDYHRVFGRYFTTNPASGKVMEKVGMSYEGTHVDDVIKDGEYKSLGFHGLINPAHK